MSVAIAPRATPTEDPASLAMPVVVVGAGRDGLAVASVLATHTRARLAGFVEPRRELRRFARGAGFRVPAEGRIERLAARGPIAAAIVCAPTPVRESLTLEALATGAAVLALHPCDPGAALDAPLRVGAPVLFHPLYARAIEFVGQGVLGRLRRLQLSVFASRVFGPIAGPRHGDVLDHFGLNALRLLDALLGPCRVASAELHALYGHGNDELHARFEAGDAEATLDASWSVPGYPRPALVIEAEGESGRLLLADDALEVELIAAGGTLSQGTSRWTLVDVGDPTRFEPGGPGLAAMVDAFLSELGAPTSARFEPAASRRVQALAEAVRKAAEPQ